MIRKALKQDLPAVGQSYRELLTHEQTHGSNSGWVLDVYPTQAWAEKCFQADSLYVLEADGRIVASMILNQVQAEEYQNIPWEYPARDGEVLVIHTLCVSPKTAGKGYGKEMVQYALTHARDMGCKVVRIDTWIGNKPAAGLYTGQGFRLAGEGQVLHQGLIPETLIYLEYKL